MQQRDCKTKWFWARFWSQADRLMSQLQYSLCDSGSVYFPAEASVLLSVHCTQQNFQPQRYLGWNVIMHNIWNTVNMLEVLLFWWTRKSTLLSAKFCAQALDVLVAAGRGELSASLAIQFPSLLLGPIHFKQPKDTAVTWWTWRVLCQVKQSGRERKVLYVTTYMWNLEDKASKWIFK